MGQKVIVSAMATPLHAASDCAGPRAQCYKLLPISADSWLAVPAAGQPLRLGHPGPRVLFRFAKCLSLEDNTSPHVW